MTTPRKSINPAFLKLKPHREKIEAFKTNLLELIDHINVGEHEEHNKNLLRDFLKITYYDPDRFINTYHRKDLVIHTGKNSDSPIGVIIETKSPSNKSEMCSRDKLNTKALQELLLYYLEERVEHKNTELKHLIVTNIYEYFIFKAPVFEKLIYKNKKFVKRFQDFKLGGLSGDRTDFFYSEIAKPFIDEIKDDLEYTYVDIRDLEKILRKNDPSGDKQLIAPFKLFSPEHMLVLPFTNDSNSLDKKFYSELLHIIGLKEVKEGSKKLIQRYPEGERNPASLLENAIAKLDSRDHLSQVDNLSSYGAGREEQLFAVGLELCITWINRILFLKLLEAQLLSYHKRNDAYKFLNIERIHNYDDLDNLFFAVLAKKQNERSSQNQKEFSHIPYLNSSLFEPAPLEHKTIFVTDLRDDLELPVIGSTVLKNEKGNKRSGTLNAIEYLFKFLDAYDFSSEGKEEIQEEHKTLINASVLGLIFEKINGYKDGSYFTPGFITEYMCRETIRRAVVQKFNETKGWDCKDLTDVYNKDLDIKDANAIVNSLKICDPAVGSGHFLVSALNEILAIKHEMKILCDADGKRLKHYQVEVVNDELIVSDREDGSLFEYHPGDHESLRVQKALFHEKQTIIENCLFGVDINPNSVKICRLRLWIELLKNAYYKNDDELETLPNIDINIKCGNSLISRFDIKADLGQALKKSKYDIDSYRDAVHVYQNAKDKDEKGKMRNLIEEIKGNFRTEIYANDPKIKKLYKLQGDLFTETNQQNLFDMSPKEKAAWEKKIERLTAESRKLEAEIEEIKNNKIYENAFEWRFEFPEVLDTNGDFIGFDVVIGNPPYVSSKSFDKTLIQYLSNNYSTSQYQLDLYVAFIEKGVNILRDNAIISLITPNSWLKNMMFSNCRKFLLENVSFNIIFPNLFNVFDEASVDSLIFIATKTKCNNNVQIFEIEKQDFKFKHKIKQSRFINNDRYVFNVETNDKVFSIIQKVSLQSNRLIDVSDITRGVNPYDKYRGQTEDVIKNKVYHASYKKDETFVPELRGKHLDSYLYVWDGKHFISYGEWLAAPRDIKYFTGPRIIMRQVLGDKLKCTIIEENYIIDQSIFISKPKKAFEKYIYAIQGVLGSKLIAQFFKFSSNEFDALFPKIKIGEFKELPVPKNLNKAEELLGEKTRNLLKIRKDKPEMDSTFIELEIDQLVYELYGLTEEEIRVVEGKSKKDL